MLLHHFRLQTLKPPFLFFFFFSTQTHPPSPPRRKARQAIRRLLKLLSTEPSQILNNAHLSETLKTLQTSPQSLSPSQASLLINCISNPLISFDFYRFLKASKPQLVLDSTVFVSLIRSQVRSTKPEISRIRYYVDEMRKNKIAFPNADFRELFASLFPDHVKFTGFFVRSVLEGLEFDVENCIHTLDVYVENGFWGEAISVVEWARVRMPNPSLEFFSCVMNVYRVIGDGKAAMELFLEMQERGVFADEGIYRVLLGILCRIGWLKLSWIVLEQMKRVGFRPDNQLALDLVRCFVEGNMFIDEAGYFFKEGVLKDSSSLSVYAEAMVEKRMPLMAIELFGTLRASGVVVEDQVYASLIRGCGEMGLIDEAEKIFNEIKQFVSRKNRELVYTSIIYVYSRAGMRKSAEMVWNEMQVGEVFGGGGEVCLYMMSMYRSLGLVRDVVMLFDRWKGSSCCLNVDAYVLLVDALCKSGKLNQARDCLLEMRSVGICPSNSIYLSMMDSYLRTGLLNHAIRLLDEYKMSGLRVDNEAASVVARILIQAGRYSELEFTLDGFLRRGITISRDKAEILVKMCRDDACLRKLGQLIQP